MKRNVWVWLFGGAVLLAACASTVSVATDSGASEGLVASTTVDEPFDDTAMTQVDENVTRTTEGVGSERFETGGLSCPAGTLLEDEDSDFDEGPLDPITAENTAESAAAWFMSEANNDFLLRPDDWQLLALDTELSTQNRFFYSDGEGFPYLRLDLENLGGVWVIAGLTTCTLLSETGPNVTIVPAVER